MTGGMSINTGKALTGRDHIRQSVTDILSTMVGSRTMRRDYGSILPRLIDQPRNNATILKLYAATAQAIATHEPRLNLTGVKAYASGPGGLILDIRGVEVESGDNISLEVEV